MQNQAPKTPTAAVDNTYLGRVTAALGQLGVPESYTVGRRPFPEAADLVPAGRGIHGYEQMLAPPAAAAWQVLRVAAERDGITLLLVSGFRSLAYQKEIFERKRAAGQSLEQILKVNAAPGYSEHHTGRAVDLTTPGTPPLLEGFVMTYPRNNPLGVIYEPWHWTFHEATTAPGGPRLQEAPAQSAQPEA
jgi:D-alanyl-D-alanine carboxypeptidase